MVSSAREIMARPLNVLVWGNHVEWAGYLFLGGAMSKEAMLIAEVTVLTEMVRVLSDKLAIEQNKQEQGEPVIAGALFDFMGWLTSRKERLVLSSADEASPAVDAIRDFAKMRGLSLDDARVQDWNTTPQQRTWVGLTDEEILDVNMSTVKKLIDEPIVCDTDHNIIQLGKAIEAKLKEKNNG
jgi:hypothetical protein